MGGRLNWDRVRTETLSRRHGSEWVNPFAEQYSYSRPNRQKREGKNRDTKKRSHWALEWLGARAANQSDSEVSTKSDARCVSLRLRLQPQTALLRFLRPNRQLLRCCLRRSYQARALAALPSIKN